MDETKKSMVRERIRMPSGQHTTKSVVKMSDTTDGTLEEIIARLTKIKEYGESRGYTNISIAYDWGGGDYESTCWLEGERLETNAEATERLEQEKEKNDRAVRRQRWEEGAEDRQVKDDLRKLESLADEYGFTLMREEDA